MTVQEYASGRLLILSRVNYIIVMSKKVLPLSCDGRRS